jgi:hypothetical protein
MGWEKKKILVTVKVYPEPSRKHGASISTAGIKLFVFRPGPGLPVPTVKAHKILRSSSLIYIFLTLRFIYCFYP